MILQLPGKYQMTEEKQMIQKKLANIYGGKSQKSENSFLLMILKLNISNMWDRVAKIPFCHRGVISKYQL